ncbi:glyoxylase-like metal-dependent hydrolase (beta-lactamase superfamily II) [Agromyces terreus]|uniref:Glyoxylase-like metal-dependent hydrolase (Beta-lactamase superfamily II) n=1 Tax=Agromyces terreus TaxID=424795 RepID=A0A9X2GYL1_9MICO|nr:MBL fold metallo-hydrolase [Agromyces terreus]MCP2369718.1 glyoxylase-like metal-dependent hydrolase (beta-lactamase superfamily II) [Agromyces terreus]
MELRPGLHRIQAPLGERFVALYLLVGEDAALLVDTGVRDSITDHLLPYLDAAGIPREKLRWAVDTHCDFDHTGGNGALKAAIPTVEIVAHELDAELVEDVQRLIDVRYGEFRDTDGFDDPPETTAYLRSVSDLVPVDRRVSGGETFDLGGRSVRVLHVPGHSPGHVAVHDEANRALLIGDATLGTTVMLADGSPAFPPTYRDTDPYVESLRAFRALDAELLLTAHYPVYEGEAVARFLDESEAYTERIDEIMTELLRSRDAAAAPLTTLELVREAGSDLGPWGADALDYSVFPVTGNLERLEQRGLAASDTDATGRRTWRWAR